MSLVKQLTVKVVDGELRISVGLDALAFAIKYQDDWPENYLPDPSNNYKLFGSSIINALSEEDEDGTTRVHRMLDSAAEYALEQGYEGFVEIVDEFDD